MTSIRNNDGKIVCFLDEVTGNIEIKVKGCKTVIKIIPGEKPEIINSRS